MLAQSIRRTSSVLGCCLAACFAARTARAQMEQPATMVSYTSDNNNIEHVFALEAGTLGNTQ